MNVVLYCVHSSLHDLYPQVILWKPYYLTANGWLLLLVVANMLLVAFLRLQRIFQNNKERLRAYYVFQGIGLLCLTLAYLMHFFLGTVMGLLAPWFVGRNYLSSEASNDRHLRGTQLLSVAKTQRYYRGRLTPENPGFLWGGARIPESEAVTHFLVAGASGSGKTVTLRLLMQDILPRITEGSRKRAIIYDAQRNMLPILAGMGLQTKVCILNPFDDRCHAWDIAADINTLAAAESLVHILVPREGDREDEFFRSASIQLFQGVIEFFIGHAPGAWTLRDVVIVLQSLELTVGLLGSDPATRHFLQVLGSEKTADNIMSTVATKIGQYRTIAALWHRAEHKISLRQWVQGSSILVLGIDNEAETILSTLNRVIFTRAAQLLLNGRDQPSGQPPSTFIVLDELPGLGKIDKLHPLATRGRSKGVCLVVGFQSMEDLRRIYGDGMSEAITGQFRHKAMLRLDEPRTAEWTAQSIGEQQLDRKTKVYKDEGGELFGYNDPTGKSQQIITERTVLPAEFLNIPPIDSDQGLTGYYRTRFTHKHTYPLRFLAENLQPPNKACADFFAAPDHYQRLRLWDREDWKRLGITSIMQRLEQRREAKQRDEQRIKPSFNAGNMPTVTPPPAPELDLSFLNAEDNPPPPNGTLPPGLANRDKDHGQSRR
ncbi:MAG: type IV secretion system DNA-binding domain-containing protein [Stenomitos rutilans HA7619-LM2]|nr:type IV secretion system DNA-binding domain-containing protein [Stenomitos rutilans HA7619-LM2]